MTRGSTYDETLADLESELVNAMDVLDAELSKLPPYVRELIDPRIKQPRTRTGRIAKAWRVFVENVRYHYRLIRAARHVAQARARYRK